MTANTSMLITYLIALGGQDYGHYLDGDGYLTRVTIDNGKVIDITEQLWASPIFIEADTAI
jgi:carotenoid cleavage dioxygenase-like enzyme